MKIQIGTIGYKEDCNIKNTYPLYAEESDELIQATKSLFNIACEMFIADLFAYATSKLCEDKKAR